MKHLLLSTVFFSSLAMAASSSIHQGSGYAPNDGTAKPGNPGTFTSKGGLGSEAPTTSGTGTSLRNSGTMGNNSSPSTASDNAVDASASGRANIIQESTATRPEEINPSVNPVPQESNSGTFNKTLSTGKGSTIQAEEEDLDFSTKPGRRVAPQPDTKK